MVLLTFRLYVLYVLHVRCVTRDAGPSGRVSPPRLAGRFPPRAVGSEANQGGANAAASGTFRQQVRP